MRIGTAEGQFELSRELRRLLNSRIVQSSAKASVEDQKDYILEGPFAFDANRDVRFSQNDNGLFRHSLILFTQQWVGIRQACGAFPGHKLAIDSHNKFTLEQVEEILALLHQHHIKSVFVHGMAPSTSKLLRVVKRAMPELRIFGVWHGTMAGWSYSEELALFREFLSLAQTRIFEKIGFLRTGMHHLSEYAFPKTLVNLVPKTDIERATLPFFTKPLKCIFPSWNNQWKNMFTNVVGAQSSPYVDEILAYSQSDIDIFSKLKHVPFIDHSAHMHRLSLIDLCLNVSVNDCQPMTELEGLSVGTPSLRGDLDLDFVTLHEYERLFTVSKYLNADAIRSKISDLAALDGQYIFDIVVEYRQLLYKRSFERYSEFIN
ncbi:hypothetical protein [Methylobacterium segetis]|uniref:hypothetical protein n=1 Tax=Methylobacterium segetis TaxID=2488750 RepID=UPI001046DFDF|nr:hypothetical protein [Methylobacterium segetis]